MNPLAADASSSLGHFVDKWWRREPEMRIASVFCARADAPHDQDFSAELAEVRFHAWGALLHELREALFELSDPGVAAAKRGWWAEEMDAIARAQPRHPLGAALASLPEATAAPWTSLALALAGAGVDERNADTAQTLASLRPLARELLAVENALFRVRDAGESEADALVVHWLLQRLPAGLGEADAARVPMHLLARHGLTVQQLPDAPATLLRDWAGELLQALPRRNRGAFQRRARQRFDEARLRRLASPGAAATSARFHEPAQLSTLWRAWRAARGP